jgi:hypothetical protein
LLILGLGVLSVWLIVDVFHFVDRRLPWIRSGTSAKESVLFARIVIGRR